MLSSKEGYSELYLDSRRRIDSLCDGIRAGSLSAEAARNLYDKIEKAFTLADPEKAALFKMIYSSRIDRLCGQFQTGGA